MKLVIVTGLSGSGKSIALHTLEDLGFYCMDNLPVFLLHSLANELAEKRDDIFKKTAVGIDARNQRAALGQLPEWVKDLRQRGVSTEMVFLEADEDTLIRRYSETRRRHPLSSGKTPLAEAIQTERAMLQSFRSVADLVIDTSCLTQHQLRDMIRERLDGQREDDISILFESFGYKLGVPRDADFVYDLRCLPNPHWDRELRHLTGRDLPVKAFLAKEEQVQAYRQAVIGFLEDWIPRFSADARSYLTVALGCTGGQHRSVYMAEEMLSHFRKKGLNALVRHRELS